MTETREVDSTVSAQEPPGVAYEDYDFLDFGASNGGSLEMARNVLGGRRGLGIDLDPEKVAKMERAGLECVEGDLTRFRWPSDSARFSVVSHVLEHLRSRDDVKAVVETAIRVSTDFVYIAGPWYDADDYLEDLGLRPYWSNWSGHTYHLRVAELVDLLGDLGAHDFRLFGRARIYDSEDPALHSTSVGRNQHEFDPEVHPEKPIVLFDRKLYREFICCVRLPAISEVRWALLCERIQRYRRAEANPLQVHRPTSEDRDVETLNWPQTRQHSLVALQSEVLVAGPELFLTYVHLRDAINECADVREVSIEGIDRAVLAALEEEYPDLSFSSQSVPRASDGAYVGRAVLMGSETYEWEVLTDVPEIPALDENTRTSHSEEILRVLASAVDYSDEKLVESMPGLRSVALRDVVWSRRDVVLGPTRGISLAKKS